MADAILLVYDISDKISFDKIKDYYCQKIKQLCKEKIPIILLGNKTDMENEREVTIDEGAKLAKKENYLFKETSCLKNENVASSFEALIELWNIENKKNISDNKSINEDKKKLQHKSNSTEKKKNKKSKKNKKNDESFQNCNSIRNSISISTYSNPLNDFNFEKEKVRKRRFTLQPYDVIKNKKKKKKCC